MLLNDGEAVACVVPAGKTCTGAELATAWAGVPHLGSEEATSFAADLAESRKELRSVSSPWDLILDSSVRRTASPATSFAGGEIRFSHGLRLAMWGVGI